mmetsp:Transcript_2711/g.3258  ORF Transcript_2711/g.3258 Transcript_2711/m.3258 type:complete len:101 (-) Transcript_2711:67-369(-)
MIKPTKDNTPASIARPSKNTCLFVESSRKQGKGLIRKVTSSKPRQTITVPRGMIKFASIRKLSAEDNSKTYTTFATAMQKANDSNSNELGVLCLAERSDV